MIYRRLLAVLAVAAPLLVAISASATLIVDPAQTITRQVTVQLIQTALTDGSSPATVFGNATQRANIEGGIDRIWAQAGIDINFLPNVTRWNNTFAYQGNNGAGTRSQNDLSINLTSAAAAGVLSSDPLTLNLLLVNVVPGFAPLAENQAAGLAWTPGNGINAFAGDLLLTPPYGQDGLDVIAKVIAHEIGHNLGLQHTSAGSANLMANGNGTTQQLTSDGSSSQVSIARSSNFARLYTPPILAGDYNGNHIVDAADYAVWRNSNGTVGNYSTWRSNFGKTGGAGSGLDDSGTGAVPEPGALACLLIAISARMVARRKRGGMNNEKGHHGGISTI
jgi:hypothetical protein